ncbi:MAG: hypothetical protein E6K70_03825 [Planctomycetota bacterium]|nr:MAG: hypothetical protein E6K70_03825 [Planctomycetota bacterium]HMC88132.1 hypothetical protein [Gemmataceae bacterium]
MANAIQELERRLERLEKTVEDMRSRLLPKTTEPWWKQTLGMFKGDKAFEEIMEEVRTQRQADYDAVNREIDELEAKEARRKNSKSRRTRKAHRAAKT